MSAPGELLVLTGCDGPELAALRRALAAAGAPALPDARARVDAHLGRRRDHPPAGGAGRHVCPACEPFGYARRLLATQDELEGAAPAGALLSSGRACHVARLLLEVEAHKRPLVPVEEAAYRTVFLAEAHARSQRALARARVENNLLRAEHERHGSPVVLVPRGTPRERARFVLDSIAELVGARTGLPPVLGVRRGPAQAMVRAIRAALRRAGIEAPGELLLRVTEGFNLELVRLHGTDRADRDRPMSWGSRGYDGPSRSFADVLYATPEGELGRKGRSPTALDKLDETPGPLVLVYDRAAFERVRGREFAFRPGVARRDALVAVVRTT